MNTKSNIYNIIGWIFAIVFFILGILNILLVHVIPGALYLIISLIYFPPLDDVIKRKIRLPIPFMAKIIIGIVILWGTLAVGNLAEMFGL